MGQRQPQMERHDAQLHAEPHDEQCERQRWQVDRADIRQPDRLRGMRGEGQTGEERQFPQNNEGDVDPRGPQCAAVASMDDKGVGGEAHQREERVETDRCRPPPEARDCPPSPRGTRRRSRCAARLPAGTARRRDRRPDHSTPVNNRNARAVSSRRRSTPSSNQGTNASRSGPSAAARAGNGASGASTIAADRRRGTSRAAASRSGRPGIQRRGMSGITGTRAR